MKLRHIRGGRELAPIAQVCIPYPLSHQDFFKSVLLQDNNYDSNYQQPRMLSQEVTIMPGDGIITECTYSTKDKNYPVTGGFSSDLNEMCAAFMLHYPKTEFGSCFSIPPAKYFFETFGVKELYNKDINDIDFTSLFQRSK